MEQHYLNVALRFYKHSLSVHIRHNLPTLTEEYQHKNSVKNFTSSNTTHINYFETIYGISAWTSLSKLSCHYCFMQLFKNLIFHNYFL